MVDELLPCDASAPGRARRFIEEAFGDLDQAILDNVELLTTELVTNSLRHDCSEPGAKVELMIKQDGRALRVSVKDGGSGTKPVVAAPSASSEGGRGLMLVDAIADEWGTESRDGLLTWFSVNLDDSSIQKG